MGNTSSFAAALSQVEGTLLKLEHSQTEGDACLQALSRILPFWQEEGVTRFPLTEYKNVRLLEALLRILSSELRSVNLSAKDFSGVDLERLIVIAECLEKLLSSKALYKHLPSCDLGPLVLLLRTAFRMPTSNTTAFALLPRLQLQVVAVVFAVIERVGFEEAKEQSKEQNQVKREAAAKAAFSNAGGLHAMLEALACLHGRSNPLIVDAVVRLLVSFVCTHQDTSDFGALQQLLSALRPCHGLLWEWGRSDYPRLRVSAAALLRGIYLESSVNELFALQLCALEWGALLWHFRLAIAPCADDHGIAGASAADRSSREEQPLPARCVPWSDLLASFPSTPALTNATGRSAIPLHLSVPLHTWKHNPLAREASREMVALLCLRNAKSLSALRRMLPSPMLRCLYNDNPALLKGGAGAASALAVGAAIIHRDRVVVDRCMFVSPSSRSAPGDADKINGDLAAVTAAASGVSGRKRLARGMSGWLRTGTASTPRSGSAAAASSSSATPSSPDNGGSGSSSAEPLFSVAREKQSAGRAHLWTSEVDMPVGVGPRGVLWWDLRLSALPTNKHQRMVQAEKVKVKLLGVKPTKSAAAHWRPTEEGEADDGGADDSAPNSPRDEKEGDADAAKGSKGGLKRTKSNKSTRALQASAAAAVVDAGGVLSLQRVGGLRWQELWAALVDGRGFQEAYSSAPSSSSSAASSLSENLVDRTAALRAAMAGSCWNEECLSELRGKLWEAEAGLDKKRRALRRDVTAGGGAYFGAGAGAGGHVQQPSASAKTAVLLRSPTTPRGKLQAISECSAASGVASSLLEGGGAAGSASSLPSDHQPDHITVLPLVDLAASLFLPGSPYINGGQHPQEACFLIPDTRGVSRASASGASTSAGGPATASAASVRRQTSANTAAAPSTASLSVDSARKGVGSMTAADLLQASGAAVGAASAASVSTPGAGAPGGDASAGASSASVASATSSTGLLSSLRANDNASSGSSLASSLLAVPSFLSGGSSGQPLAVPLLPLPVPHIPFDHGLFELPMLTALARLLTISGVWIGPFRQWLLSLASLDAFTAVQVSQGLSLPPGFPISLWHAIVAMTSPTNASSSEDASLSGLLNRKLVLLSTLRLLAQIVLPQPSCSSASSSSPKGGVNGRLEAVPESTGASVDDEPSVQDALAEAGNGTRMSDNSLARALGLTPVDFGGEPWPNQPVQIQPQGAVGMLLWALRELEATNERLGSGSLGMSEDELRWSLAYRQELVLLLRSLLTQHSVSQRLLHPLLPQQPQPLLPLIRLLIVSHSSSAATGAAASEAVASDQEADWTIARAGHKPYLPLPGHLLSLAAAETLHGALQSSPSLAGSLAAPEAMTVLVAALLQDAATSAGVHAVKAAVLKILRFAFLSVSSSPSLAVHCTQAAERYGLVKALILAGVGSGSTTMSTDAAALLQRLHVARYDEESFAPLLEGSADGSAPIKVASTDEEESVVLPAGTFAMPPADAEGRNAESRSSLHDLLPTPLITLLRHKGAESFLEVFNVQGTFASATTMWSASMRRTLVERLSQHSEIASLANWASMPCANWGAIPVPSEEGATNAAVHYPQLAACPVLEGIYLQAYVEGAAAPADLSRFLKALSEGIHTEVRLLASAHRVMASSSSAAEPGDAKAAYDQQHERCLLFLRSLRRLLHDCPGTRLEPATGRAVAVLLGLSWGRYPTDALASPGAHGFLHPDQTALIRPDTQAHPSAPYLSLLLPSSASASSSESMLAITLERAFALRALVTGKPAQADSTASKSGVTIPGDVHSLVTGSAAAGTDIIALSRKATPSSASAPSCLLTVALDLVAMTLLPHGQTTPSKKAISAAADAKLLDTLLQLFTWITPGPISSSASSAFSATPSSSSITSASSWSHADCIRGFLFAPIATAVARLLAMVSETDPGTEWFLTTSVGAADGARGGGGGSGVDVPAVMPIVRAVGLLTWARAPPSASAAALPSSIAAPASALLRCVPACLQILFNLCSVFAMRRPLLDAGVVPVLLSAMTGGGHGKDAKDHKDVEVVFGSHDYDEASSGLWLHTWALREKAEQALRLLTDKTLHASVSSADGADDFDDIAAEAAAAMMGSAGGKAQAGGRKSMAAAPSFSSSAMASLRTSTFSAANGPLGASSRKLSTIGGPLSSPSFSSPASGGGGGLNSYRSQSMAGSFAAAAAEKSVRTSPPQTNELQATTAIVASLSSMVTPFLAALIMTAATASTALQGSGVDAADVDAAVKDIGGVRSVLPILVLGAKGASCTWRDDEDGEKLRALLVAELVRLEAAGIMIKALDRLTKGAAGGTTATATVLPALIAGPSASGGSNGNPFGSASSAGGNPFGAAPAAAAQKPATSSAPTTSGNPFAVPTSSVSAPAPAPASGIAPAPAPAPAQSSPATSANPFAATASSPASVAAPAPVAPVAAKKSTNPFALELISEEPEKTATSATASSVVDKPAATGEAPADSEETKSAAAPAPVETAVTPAADSPAKQAPASAEVPAMAAIAAPKAAPAVKVVAPVPPPASEPPAAPASKPAVVKPAAVAAPPKPVVSPVTTVTASGPVAPPVSARAVPAATAAAPAPTPAPAPAPTPAAVKAKAKDPYGDSDNWEAEIDASFGGDRLDKMASSVMKGFGVDMDELVDDTVGSKSDPTLAPPKPLSESRKAIWPPQNTSSGSGRK